MKVKKTVNLDRDNINITCLFERVLVESCDKTSNKYRNQMGTFETMLQEVADKAFALGQEEPK